MKIRWLVALVLVAGMLPVRPSAAQIIIVGQDRRAAVSAFVNSAGDFDQQQFTEVAPDTGPFDVSLLANAVIADATANGTATQISEITTTLIRSEGNVDGSAEALAEGATAYGFAQSTIAIRFTLVQPSAFSLLGFIEGTNSGGVTVQLSRPFQTVAWFSATDEHVDLSQTGMLEGDTYDLNITCSAGVAATFPEAPDQGSSVYDVRFLLGQSTDAPVVAVSPVQAFPNPFRDSVHLVLPADAREARILDARGRVVRTLAGSSSVLFDGRDASGRPLASGVYWVKPVGATNREAIKLVRLR